MLVDVVNRDNIKRPALPSNPPADIGRYVVAEIARDLIRGRRCDLRRCQCLNAAEHDDRCQDVADARLDRRTVALEINRLAGDPLQFHPVAAPAFCFSHNLRIRRRLSNW